MFNSSVRHRSYVGHLYIGARITSVAGVAMDPCNIFLVILELFRKLLKLSSNDRPVVLSFQISFLCSPLMSSSMSSHSLPCPRSTDATALGFVSVCPGKRIERRYYRNWSVVKFRRICCNKSDLYICGMSDIVKMVLN